MLSRILVAVPVIGLIIFSIFERYTNNILFSSLILIFAAMAALEYFNIIKSKITKWSKFTGIFSVILFLTIVLLTKKYPDRFVIILGAAFIPLILLFFGMINRKNFDNVFEEVCISFLPVIYIGFGFGSLIMLKEIPFKGSFFVLYTFIIVWLTDSFAYFVGRLIGKHKLGITASPNKTIEGTLGGILFALTGAVILKKLFPDIFSGNVIFEWKVYLLVTLFLSLIGQIGDLAESVMKRSFKIKDSSSIVPGHGGFLDVFDAQILVSPVFYLILILFYK